MNSMFNNNLFDQFFKKYKFSHNFIIKERKNILKGNLFSLPYYFNSKKVNQILNQGRENTDNTGSNDVLYHSSVYYFWNEKSLWKFDQHRLLFLQCLLSWKSKECRVVPLLDDRLLIYFKQEKFILFSLKIKKMVKFLFKEDSCTLKAEYLCKNGSTIILIQQSKRKKNIFFILELHKSGKLSKRKWILTSSTIPSVIKLGKNYLLLISRSRIIIKKY